VIARYDFRIVGRAGADVAVECGRCGCIFYARDPRGRRAFALCLGDGEHSLEVADDRR
jgi:hypothetical protein